MYDDERDDIVKIVLSTDSVHQFLSLSDLLDHNFLHRLEDQGQGPEPDQRTDRPQGRHLLLHRSYRYSRE